MLLPPRRQLCVHKKREIPAPLSLQGAALGHPQPWRPRTLVDYRYRRRQWLSPAVMNVSYGNQTITALLSSFPSTSPSQTLDSICSNPALHLYAPWSLLRSFIHQPCSSYQRWLRGFPSSSYQWWLRGFPRSRLPCCNAPARSTVCCEGPTTPWLCRRLATVRFLLPSPIVCSSESCRCQHWGVRKNLGTKRYLKRLTKGTNKMTTTGKGNKEKW